LEVKALNNSSEIMPAIISAISVGLLNVPVVKESFTHHCLPLLYFVIHVWLASASQKSASPATGQQKFPYVCTNK
jgi:hypothetical protein